MSHMKISLSNSITYGIGTNNKWQVLQRIGNPSLQSVPIEYLIAENLQINGTPAIAITKLIGDGHGKYGISITSFSGNKPITHATVVNEAVLNQILQNPSCLVKAFVEHFQINSRIAEYAFGFDNPIRLSEDLFSTIVRLSMGYRFRRSSISIKYFTQNNEVCGLFSLLKLFWSSFPKKSKLKIFATYSGNNDLNESALLLASRKLTHVLVEFSSATHYCVSNYSDNLVRIRYQTVFDFLRSFWPW